MQDNARSKYSALLLSIYATNKYSAEYTCSSKLFVYLEHHNLMSLISIMNSFFLQHSFSLFKKSSTFEKLIS